MTLRLAAILLLLPAAATCLQAGEVTTKAAEKLTLSGYTQGQAAYRDNMPDSLVNNAVYVKRARTRLAADITKHTQSELEIDFASSKLVKDAILIILPSDALRIQVGQYKRPFSQEELFSSTATPVTDLGLTNALVTTKLGFSGRSQGLAAAYKPPSGKLDVQAGIFTGAGESDLAVGDKLLGKQTDLNNRGKDWAARAGALLGEGTTLHVAANATSRSVGGTYTDGGGIPHRAQDFLAWGGDAELKSGGLTVWAEALTGDNFSSFTDTAGSYAAPTFLGWHVAGNLQRPISGEHLFTAWQLEGRFEMFDPDLDTDLDGANMITGGVALFLGKNMRWRTDGEWTTLEAGDTTNFRLVSELQAKF
jgi:hypothetical protein